MSIEMEEHPKHISLAALAEQCMRDDRHWLELLRRATAQRDAAARQMVWHHLSQVIEAWLAGHPQKELACRLESKAYYVAQACDRLWQAIAQQKLASNRLAAVLPYGRACLNSVILDTLRTYAQTTTSPSSGSTRAGKAVEEHHEDSRAWWERIREMLPTEREQRAAHLLFSCGLQPKDIVRLCPQEFSDWQEISLVRRTVIKQLLASGITSVLTGQQVASEETTD
jgi:hypothetical protein